MIEKRWLERAQRLYDGPIGGVPRSGAEIVREVAAALQAAHEGGERLGRGDRRRQEALGAIYAMEGAAQSIRQRAATLRREYGLEADAGD